MAVREVERRFDAHLGAEIITLENSFGVRHVVTVHLLADHGKCPTCGAITPHGEDGYVDVDAVIAQVKAAMEAAEAKLAAHAEKRGFDMSGLKGIPQGGTGPRFHRGGPSA